VEVGAGVAGVAGRADEPEAGLFDVGAPADAFDGAAAHFDVALGVDAFDGRGVDHPLRDVGAVQDVDLHPVRVQNGRSVVTVQPQLAVETVRLRLGMDLGGPLGHDAHTLAGPPPARRPGQLGPQAELVLIVIQVGGQADACEHVVPGDPGGIVLAVPGQPRQVHGRGQQFRTHRSAYRVVQGGVQRVVHDGFDHRAHRDAGSEGLFGRHGVRGQHRSGVSPCP
jgi:hypothetical protein